VYHINVQLFYNVKFKSIFLPDDVVASQYVFRSQVPKLVHQINKIVPVVYQKRLQIAETTIFNDL
jgi:hypothetical protein